MLKTYIFDDANKKWIEENKSLLYHDLCAILDEEQSTIYLWNGPKSSQERLKKGFGLLESLIASYPAIDFQLLILKKKVPHHIQTQIDLMLSEIKQKKEKNRYQFSRFTSLRLYLIFLLVSLTFPILSFLNLVSSLSWPQNSGIFEIGADAYHNWLLISSVFVIISLISFSAMIIIGIIETEYQVVIFSLLGVLICSGLTIYFQQGIFLFLFQEGHSASLYYISQNDIIEVLIIVFFGLI
ncbi:MAG: hypothetical protein ACFE96_03030, partial [Candidatus Hermodarchaeota archaeon]